MSRFLKKQVILSLLFRGTTFMRYFLGLLLATITISAAAEPNRCEIYLQIEENVKCTQRKNDYSNYLTNFGYAYCHQFTKAAENWDPELQMFIQSVAKCLQEEVIKNFTNGFTCNQAEKAAFYTAHPRCYYSTGFCDLSFKQQLQVAKIARFDLLFKPQISISVGFQLLKSCMSNSSREQSQDFDL